MAPHDDAQHLERLRSGSLTCPKRMIEAAVRKWHAGSVAWHVYAATLQAAYAAFGEKLVMCPVPLLGCLWDSAAPARRNLLVSASATRMCVAYHMGMVRENEDSLARQL